ncbi:Calpain-like protease palB/RIM13 [Sparassis crispa]|uniref:Calpain-like protease palB/RIM13 n=1 Tax=Sparassis crispa TaxID=139825 RepID=A0A401GF01_9APHY|nr:Calpain-like protease palB/RIM13 [Sparassis crispa]GBE80774.1 Calpain-like protease palB/RIM13 [Sparassis crispa]
MSSKRSGMALQDAEGTYAKAAKAELEKDLDRAFRLYIKAAEGFLYISQYAADSSLRTTSRNEAAKALERAEKIKLIRQDLTPVIKNHFSDQEQIHVLKKSSTVNNIRLPLWDEDCPDDLSQPNFSPDQQQHSASWRRIGAGTNVYSSSLLLLPQDIIQHIISDCSVCGSIAICINHHRRFNSKIGLSSFYPQAPEGVPRHSDAGYYWLRVYFNGALRRVKVDDQLPMYPDGTLMCMSTGDKLQLWPLLVEKAYMKLMGGYDFPGSNSSFDLHALAGWIPDHVDLRSPFHQREKTWSRVLAGFARGHCIFTVGTGTRLVVPKWSSFTLLPAHCYAVIDMQDSDGDRTLTVLDSWVQSQRTINDPEKSDNRVSESHTQHDQPRTLNISWDAIHDIFDGIYLSWDPGIFRHQLFFHGMWKSNIPGYAHRVAHFPLRLRTQQGRSIQGSRDVWILLSRHVTDISRKSEYIALLVTSGNETTPALENPSISKLQGEYSTGMHVLVKTQLSTSTTILSLVASYDGDFEDVGFTVTAYSNVALSWIEDSSNAPYSKQIDGAFTTKCAGGNYSYQTFLTNPQYHLRIHSTEESSVGPIGSSKARISVVLQACRKLPMNATLVWSQGDRVTEFGRNDVALSSGPYSYGYAQGTSDLPVGDYTLIVSTFEPQQLGKFSLKVESSHRIELTPIPQEGAGMFNKVIHGAWTVETAAGSPSFNQYSSNPKYEIKLETSSQLKIRLQLDKLSSTTSANITLFRSTEQLPMSVLVATSGPYSDAVSGVVTPQMKLQPGTYLAVPSTYNPGIEGSFTLNIYSTSAVKVTPG